MSANSRKIRCGLLPMMFASTLSRPRWAIASTQSPISCAAARSIAISTNGIRLSDPSSEKLLAPRNRFWMNSSNTAAVVICR